jgi:hypothetical protein
MNRNLGFHNSPAGRNTVNTQQPQNKDAIAAQAGPVIVEVLAQFVRHTLAAEPEIKNLLHIWECAWQNSAGEISVFLHEDEGGSEFHLRLFYIEKMDKLPSAPLLSSDIKNLCQQLQQKTGLRVVSRA